MNLTLIINKETNFPDFDVNYLNNDLRETVNDRNRDGKYLRRRRSCEPYMQMKVGLQ